MSAVAEKKIQAFQLKGSLFTITVLQLFTAEQTAFQTHLQQTVSQAPKFFENAPIVLDMNEFNNNNESVNFEILLAEMRKAKLIPFGVRGGNAELQQQATAAGLAILHNSPDASHITKATNKKLSTKNNSAVKATDNISSTEPSTTNTSAMVHTKIITQPVRSGQQIYAKNSDLIILSSVSHGAEILADGHIHVYGPLRGRALAGILGNTEARIFCRSLDAELISIAGHYLVNEQLDEFKDIHDLTIHLENDQLKVVRI